MQYKTLSVLLFSATALAAAVQDLEKKQYSGYGEDSSNDGGSDAYYNSLMAGLNSLETDTNYMDFLTAANDLPTGYQAYMPSGAANANPTAGTANQMTDFTMPTDVPNMPSGVNLPPASIESVLITAVPASYLQQLANPSARSSLFNEIHNGHYPAWYNSLPGSVKSWLSTNYLSATMPAGAGATTGGSSGASATAGSGSSGSTSTGGAPVPTGAVAASLAGAAGILGLAIML